MRDISTHAPARGATPARLRSCTPAYFYSRPCERGDSLEASKLWIEVISTHAPARGATSFLIWKTKLRLFLLTPLREGRQDTTCTARRKPEISTHAPARGATARTSSTGASTAFLLTPLREGRLITVVLVAEFEDFYSRPCERGDVVCHVTPLHHFRISTHAPARGATLNPFSAGLWQWISTHAPARGATQASQYPEADGDFYSRPCERGDAAPSSGSSGSASFLLTPLREGRHPSDHIAVGQPCISTHAPARGATWICKQINLRRKYFYSRPCERGDLRRGDGWGDPKEFLLTPLREGRLVLCRDWMRLSKFLLTPLREGRRGRLQRFHTFTPNFYSRPCERGDRRRSGAHWRSLRISTHAPARGATTKNFTDRSNHLFLLTPLREGRPFLPTLNFHVGDFISTHAPARGATAILHKTGIGSGFKLQKTHIVFDPDFSNSCVNPQKAVQIIGIVCANLPQNSV